MSNLVFPAAIPGLTYVVSKKSVYGTLVHTAANQAETRILQTQNPIWMFELIYEFLSDDVRRLTSGFTYTDLKIMMGFFMQMQGRFSSFLFEDPDDHHVGPALITGSPNPQAILQVVDDGAGHYYSPIQRNMGGEFYEDITDLKGAIAVYANASLQVNPTNYTVGGPGLAIPNASFVGLYLAWADPAAAWQGTHSYALNSQILDPAGHIQKYVATVLTLTQVAAGADAVYSYSSFTGPVPRVGMSVVVTGFPTGGNNVTGTLTAVSGGASGTVTMALTTQVNETNAASGTTTTATSGSAIPEFNDGGGTTADGTVTWTDQGYNPGPATPVTAAFEFYFRVRFQTDEQGFDKWANQWWTAGGSDASGSTPLRLQTVRVPAL